MKKKQLQKVRKQRCLKFFLNFTILFLLLGGLSISNAQTVQWIDGPPTVNQPMINLSADEAATISISFYVRTAPIANAKVQITLPAGVAYVAGSAAVAVGNESGAISASVSGQVVTVNFTENSGSLLAEKKVAFTLKTATTANTAGCSFESGNVDIKVLSGSTLVTNGGQADILVIDALKPAFAISPKSAGPTGGTLTNGSSVVAGLANPGTGGVGTDKGTFKINIATTSRTAKGLRLTFTVDATATYLENFALGGTVLSTQPTRSGNTYTMNLPDEVFSTTSKEISFDAYSKYSGAHPITIGYQYTPAVNCVNGSIASVYSLNYVPVVGTPYFARPTLSFVMPVANPNNLLSAANINNNDIPTDDNTFFYSKHVYKNTGSATAIEVNTACGYSEGGYQFYYIDENQPVYYSIDGGIPKVATTKTYSENLANNGARRLKTGMTSKRKRVAISIPDEVPVNSTLTIFYPTKGGLIYDHSAKFNTYNAGICFGFNGTRYAISSKNANGETGGLIADDNCSGYNNTGILLFMDQPSAAQIRPLNPVPYLANFRIRTTSTTLATQNKYMLLHIKVPPFVEICDAAGNAVTDIKQAVSYAFAPATDDFPVENLAGGYKVYTLKYDNNTSNVTGNFNLNYKAIDNPDPATYPVNTTDTIEFWADWNMGAVTAAQLPYRPVLERIQQTFMPVTLAVEEEGVKILSFDFQRTRKGFKDSDNNNIPDDGSEALDSEIVHNKYISHDTGNMIMTAAIKKSGTNTITNNLYVLLNSPALPLNGGANITLGTANVRIKRGAGFLDVQVTPTVVSTTRAYFKKDIALMENDTITVTIPFTFGSGGVLSPLTSPIDIKAYVDAETALVPTDPFNPEATSGYTKYGKDNFSYDIYLYSAYEGDNCCNVSYTRSDNNYFTGYFAMERIWEIAPGYTNEVRISAYPKWAEIIIPDGYELGGTYGENLYVTSIQNCANKTIPYYSKEYVETGTKYIYDLSQIYDPSITDANPVPGKCPLPAENSNIYFYNSLKATKGAPTTWTGRGVIKQGEPLLPGQPAEQVLRGSWKTQLIYTGTRITLTTPTKSVTAYSKNVSIPTVTAGNPNTTNYRMWLYVDGDVTDLKAQKLGSMDFPIPGTGIDGKWISLGTVPAQTGVDYSLTFDYANITHCAGDTIKVYTVFDNGDPAYNPTTASFASIDGDKVGAFRRIVIKPAAATILSTISVSPTTLTYNMPYTLNATVDASSSQGILKNDTLVITIPTGQEYVPNSAKVEYPIGTQTSVSASVEDALVALNNDLSQDRIFYFSTAEALGDPAFAFDGIASGVAAANQKSRLTAQFKPLCDTRLTGIRFISEPKGYNACGQPATGSGRNFRSEVMISDINTGYEFSINPVIVSNNRAFNEINKTESLQITVKKTSGAGIVEPLMDSLVITMPSALNVSGAIPVVSSGLSINTTVGVSAYRNTVDGGIRTIALNLPVSTINADSQNGLNKEIVYTLSLNFTPDGQTFAINPEQTIDAIVQTNVKFNATCPDAPAAVGSGSLNVAFITALENPSSACLNMPTTLEITSDGFQGDWYKEKTKTTLLASEDNGVKYTYTPKVQQDTTFYVSAIVSGTDYGVVQVKVEMNPEVRPTFTAPAVCFGQNTVFTNTTTLGNSAAPNTVTYEWYEWTGTSMTPFEGVNFTAKSPSQAFSSGTHKAFVLATSPDGCIASSDTVDFTVNTLPIPVITGKTPACHNSSETYVTESGMSNYTWTMSKSNGTDFDGDLSPSSTENATVTWNKENVVGVISVNYTDLNGCRAATPTEYSVIVRSLPPTPPTITGPTPVCANTTELYKIPIQPGIVNYIWSVDGGAQIVSGQGTNAVEIEWTTTPGSNRLITLYTVNADGCRPTIPQELAVKVNGLTKPVVSGNLTTICTGSQEIYTTQGANSYEWFVSGGTFGTGTQFTQTTTINWGVPGTGRIAVKYTDANGCKAMSDTADVTINALPATGVIIGTFDICIGNTTQLSNPTGTAGGTWRSGDVSKATVNASGLVTGISSGSTAIWYIVSNSQGCKDSISQIITVNSSPVVLPTTGNNSVCVGGTTALLNSTSGTKVWRSDNISIASVSANGLVSGVSAGSTLIWCSVTNSSGCTDSVSFTMTVKNNPVPTINGLTSVCAGANSLTYSTENGMSNYTWSISGGNIISGGNSNQVTVNWGSTAGNAQLTVNYTNTDGCAVSAPTTYPVTINALPVPTVTGPSTVCLNETGVTYTTEQNKSNYQWTVTGGVITSGSTTNSITVNWGSGVSGEVTVNYTEGSCAASSPTTYSVTIGNQLTPGLTGPSSVCIGNDVTYTTDAGMSGYQWNIGDAALVSGSLTSQSVTINFGVSGNKTITVTYTSGSCPASVATKNIQVNTLPNPSITGPSTVCENQTGVTYTTEGSMTNYVWLVTGGVITSGGGMMDNSVTVNWGTNGTGKVSVNYNNNGCTATTAKELSVTIKPLPTPTITGNTTVCANAQGIQYTTEANMDNYTWTVVGGIIAGGQNTRAITVNWNNAGIGSVGVNYSSNGCYATTATEESITIHALPVPTITGKSSVCANETGVTYTTQTSMSNYQWTVTGGIITAGDNSHEITVTWLNGTLGTVSVNYTNGNGCTAATATSYGVTIHALPAPTITGKSSVCADEVSVTYTTEGNMSNYIWNVSGGTITNGQGTDEITVTWGSGAAGSVKVNYTNANGCTALASTNYVVTINALPVPAISGAASVCANEAGVSYSTTSGMNYYSWNVIGGTIASGTGSNTITVNWANGNAGTVSLNYINTNGCTAAAVTTYPVTINALPVPTITGPISVCANATGITYETEGAMTNYSWTVVGGTATGTSTNAITVDWANGTSGSVSVNYKTPTGCTSVNPTEVIVGISTLQTPSITGNATACVDNAVTYTTDAGMSNYAWTVDGATVSGGSINSNTVTLIWNTTGNKTVTVQYTGAGGCATTTGTKTVQVNALPNPTITGNINVCANESGVTYTTEGGMKNYVWLVTGGTITSGGGNLDNTVTVTWGAVGTGIVSVIYANINNCTAATAKELAVTIKALPLPTVTGDISVCANATNVQYSTESNKQNYTWSVVGGVIGSGQGARGITVNWNNGIAGTVSVNYSDNGCMANTATEENITINALPTPSITGKNSVCANETSVTYTTQNGMHDYTWTVVGGTITAGVGTEEITVTWGNTAAGTVMVNYANAAGCKAATEAVYAITINALPIPTITGQNTVCADASSVSYLTEGGMTNYSWIVTGGTIASGANSNNITVDWGNSTSGTVQVNYTNAGGCAAAASTTYTVAINPLPVPVISGSATVCAGATGINYTTTSGMSNYVWNITGGSIISNNGSNITVDWGTGASGTLTLSYANTSGCTPASATVYPVTINALPVPTISGKGSVCAGETTVIYTTESGMTNYSWNVTGGIIVSATNTSSVIVNWGTGVAGNVSVNYKDANGCEAVSASNYPVVINALPIPTITGKSSVCAGETGVIYTTEPGMNNYNWSVTGGTITSATNTNEITVNWDVAGIGVVKVNYANASNCEASAPSSYQVTINPLPIATITGVQGVCEGLRSEYTGPANMNSYAWTVIGGNMQGITTGEQVIVEWNVSGQGEVELTIVDVNGCTSMSVPYLVTVNAKPTFDLVKTDDAICSSLDYDLYSVIDKSSIPLNSTFSYRQQGGNWSNTSTVTPNASGTYIYEIMMNSGGLSCPSDAKTFTLEVKAQPQIRIYGSDVCIENTANFTVDVTPAGGTGSWYSSNNAVASVSKINDITAEITGGHSAGTFYISYKYVTGDGCEGYISSDIYQVYPLPTVKVEDAVICRGSSIALSNIVKDVINGDHYAVYDAVVGGSQIGSSISPTTTTIYYVEGISTNATCVSAARIPVTITVIDQPSFTLPATIDICEGGSVDLSQLITSATLSEYDVVCYTGDNAAPLHGSVVIPTLTHTLYYVQIVSKDKLCMSSLEPIHVNFTHYQDIQLTGTITLCTGTTETLINTPTAPSGAVYKWTSDDNTIMEVSQNGEITAHTEGVTTIRYNYTTINGCVGTGSKLVKANKTPELENVIHTLTICEGETIMLKDLASVTTGNKFNFYESGNLLTVDRIICDADKILEVEAENLTSGCASVLQTIQITVNAKPVFTVITPDTICEGENIELSDYIDGLWMSDYTVSYYDAKGRELNSSVVNPLVTTAYQVKAEHKVSGCISLPQEMIVEVNAYPDLTLQSNIEICSGTVTAALKIDAIRSLAVNNLEYIVEYPVPFQTLGFEKSTKALLVGTEITIDIPSGLPKGVYDANLRVLSNSCESIYPFTITVSAPVSINRQPVAPESLCDSESTLILTVEAEGENLSYQWYHEGIAIPGAEESIYEVTYSNALNGDYYVLVSSSCGSTIASETVTVGSNSLIIERKWEDVLFIYNENAMAVSFQWYKNGRAIVKDGNGQYYIDPLGVNGIYHVELTYADGSIRTTCATKLDPIDKPQTKSEEIVVYPNPVQKGQSITIEIKSRNKSTGHLKIEIIDLLGKQVYQGKTTSDITEIPVQLISGNYIVYLTTSKGEVTTHKIIVK